MFLSPRVFLFLFRQPILIFNLFKGWTDKTESTTNDEERRIVEQLWQELKPLHRLLHAYIRQQMSKLYPGLIQLDQPIPIHLTSNNRFIRKTCPMTLLFI